MSTDPTMKALLKHYKDTAEKLQNNEAISQEELYRFLGLTGIINVQTLEQLWTQEELEKTIALKQKAHCDACENTAQLRLLKEQGYFGVRAPAKEEKPKVSSFDVWLLVRDNFKSLVWAAATVLICFGVTGNLDKLGKFCIDIRNVFSTNQALIQYEPAG